jgi:hypothetical protein
MAQALFHYDIHINFAVCTLIVNQVIVNYEFDDFLRDPVPPRAEGMAERLPARHHLVGDPAEAVGDLHVDRAHVVTRFPPSIGHVIEVWIATHQIICNQEDRVP